VLILFGLVLVMTVSFAVMAVAAVISPMFNKEKKTGNGLTRLGRFLVRVVLASLSFALLSYLSTKLPHTGNAAGDVVSASAKRDAAPSATSMGLTVNEFHDAFNAAIGRYKKEFKAADFEVDTTGVTGVFKYVFSQDLAMMGTLDKDDGNVDLVIINISPNEEEKEQLRTLIVLLAITEALNPDIPVEENKKMVMDVFHQSVVNFNSAESVERRVGDLKYSARTGDHTGMMFSVVKSSEG
jgi:hypothetical protein